MASTDAKTGFRLPWSAERNEPNEPTPTAEATEPGDAVAVSGDEVASTVAPEAQETDTPPMIDVPTSTDHEAAVDPSVGEATTTAEPATGPLMPSVAVAGPARKPNKF